MATLTTEEVIYLFEKQLPSILEEQPELQPRLYWAFMKAFVSKEDVAAVYRALEAFRDETNAHFEQVDQRFEQVDQRSEQLEQHLYRFEAETRANFDNVHQSIKGLEHSINRIGQRWGIRTESLFRETMASVLEKSFGAKVEERWIDGEQFDVIITNGEHILVEITAQARRQTQRNLERKQKLYMQATGITLARVILAVGTIHSRQAEQLRQAGFEVIEPEPEA